MNNKCIINGLVILVFLILITPVVVYTFHFWDYEISNNPADWANFGSYIGGVYSVITAIAAIFITYKINNVNNAKYRLEKCVDSIIITIADIEQDVKETQEKYIALRIPWEKDDISRITRKCIIAKYYLKTFPIKYDQIDVLRESLTTLSEHATTENLKKLLEKYSIFIANLPIE